MNSHLALQQALTNASVQLLAEVCVSMCVSAPTFHTQERHQRGVGSEFQASVEITLPDGTKQVAQGYGSTKKAARAAAAMNLLTTLPCVYVHASTHTRADAHADNGADTAVPGQHAPRDRSASDKPSYAAILAKGEAARADATAADATSAPTGALSHTHTHTHTPAHTSTATSAAPAASPAGGSSAGTKRERTANLRVHTAPGADDCRGSASSGTSEHLVPSPAHKRAQQRPTPRSAHALVGSIPRHPGTAQATTGTVAPVPRHSGTVIATDAAEFPSGWFRAPLGQSIEASAESIAKSASADTSPAAPTNENRDEARPANEAATPAPASLPATTNAPTHASALQVVSDELSQHATAAENGAAACDVPASRRVPAATKHDFDSVESNARRLAAIQHRGMDQRADVVKHVYTNSAQFMRLAFRWAAAFTNELRRLEGASRAPASPSPTQPEITLRVATAEDISAIMTLIRELATFEREPDAVRTDESSMLRDGFGSHPLFHVMLAETSDPTSAVQPGAKPVAPRTPSLSTPIEHPNGATAPLAAERHAADAPIDAASSRTGPSLETNPPASTSPLDETTIAGDVTQPSAGGDKRVVAMAFCYVAYSTWEGRVLYLEDLYVKPEHRRLGISSLLFQALARAAKVSRCARMQWAVLRWNSPAVQAYVHPRLAATHLNEWDSYRLYQKDIGRVAELTVVE